MTSGWQSAVTGARRNPLTSSAGNRLPAYVDSHSATQYSPTFEVCGRKSIFRMKLRDCEGGSPADAPRNMPRDLTGNRHRT